MNLRLLFGRLLHLAPVSWERAAWTFLHLAKPAPLRLLEGTTHAGAVGRLLLHGQQDETSLFATWFFASSWTERVLGRRGAYRLVAPESVGADLSVARSHANLAGLPGRQGWHRSPEWLGLAAPVDPATGGPLRVCGSLEADLGRLRRRGLTVREEPGRDGALEFFERYYLPYARARFGSGAKVFDQRGFLEQLSRGRFVWICAPNGERLGGALYVRWHGRVTLRSVGALPELPIALAGAVFTLAYLEGFRWANSLGMPALDPGPARPSAADGLLRFKLKWNAEARLDHTSTQEYHWRGRAGDAGVQAMLGRSPVVCRDRAGLYLLGNGDGIQPFPGVERIVRWDEPLATG